MSLRHWLNLIFGVAQEIEYQKQENQFDQILIQKSKEFQQLTQHALIKCDHGKCYNRESFDMILEAQKKYKEIVEFVNNNIDMGLREEALNYFNRAKGQFNEAFELVMALAERDASAEFQSTLIQKIDEINALTKQTLVKCAYGKVYNHDSVVLARNVSDKLDWLDGYLQKGGDIHISDDVLNMLQTMSEDTGVMLKIIQVMKAELEEELNRIE